RDSGCPLLLSSASAATWTHTLSLHDALPIWPQDGLDGATLGDVLRDHTAMHRGVQRDTIGYVVALAIESGNVICQPLAQYSAVRSEEHTSELQSRENLVCRLLLEKKKKKIST